ncbi:MAG TPA: DUF2059 domain-containing protein [Bryobacteraceae bacterium]|nr:DUF2059 domain-containing protein [Bryobacteraceae bacterium]
MRYLLVALLTASSLSAASPEKTAKIEKLMDVLHVERITDEIHASLTQAINRITEQIAQQAGFPVAERASAAAEVHDKMIDAMKDMTSWERLKPGMIQVYDEEYTDEQLDAILAFFTSPVGQEYLNKSGDVQQRAHEMAGAHVKDAGDAVQALALDWLDKHKAPAPPAPAAPPK